MLLDANLAIRLGIRRRAWDGGRTAQRAAAEAIDCLHAAATHSLHANHTHLRSFFFFSSLLDLLPRDRLQALLAPLGI